jgi:DNA replication protein DnaC
VTGVYEQLKADLDYLQWPRAAECFAPLADEAKEAGWSHVEYLAKVVAEQAGATQNRRLLARLRYARFPFRRTIDDFDFSFQPSIDKKLVEDLATLRFIEEKRPIVWLGQPGCGKTHLAVALATLAVEAGYRGYFTTGADMVRQLLSAQREGNLVHKLRTYTAPTVLVIDLCRRRDYPDRRREGQAAGGERLGVVGIVTGCRGRQGACRQADSGRRAC